MPKKPLMIPFDKNGDMLNYVMFEDSYYDDFPDDHRIQNTRPFYKEAQDFDDKLVLVGSQKGRSAAKVILQSTITKQKYYMTLKDFCNYLQDDEIVLRGKFAFCKKGQNYSIKAVKNGG